MTQNDHKKPFHFKKLILTGLLFLFPIGVTYWILMFLIEKMQGISRPIVSFAFRMMATGWAAPDWLVTVVSVFIVFLFVILIGWLANFYLGKRLLSLVDKTFMRLPFVRSIYGGTKQIIEAFSFQRSSGSFKKVVLLEYPRKECWVLGFVTNEEMSQAEKLFNDRLVAVFVPSTPNPTTGFLLYLDPFDILLVDLEVEEAVKLIVSAGLVIPQIPKNRAITLAESLGLTPPERDPRGLGKEDREPVLAKDQI